MTRTAFFSTLSALLATVAAKAQSIIITPCRPKIAWGQQIPLCNGQCPNPECDHREKPFPLETMDAFDALGIPPIPVSYFQSWFYTKDELGINQQRVTTGPRLNRCPKCNTAFWQDPEKPQ